MTNRLKEMREARGLTLRQLAALVGTANQQISNLELGKRQLTVDWLIRIAAALGCHPWEIVVEFEPFSLDERERRMLENFRSLSAQRQNFLLAEMTPQGDPSGAFKRRTS